MRRHDRFATILDRLADQGSVEVDGLAGELGVSPSTVRRDLHALEEQHLLERTHGGALGNGVALELPLRLRRGRMREEKGRIAAVAAMRVADGASVALTGGTTTSEVARRLVDRERLTIVTNAINIASELAVRPNLRLILTGGVARGASYELVGPLAERGLDGIHVEIAFVGVDGISAAGLTTHDDVEAQTNRALIDHAARVVVVADASKIGSVALARICELDRVDELITDAGADPKLLEQIAGRGVTVTTT